MSLEPMQLLWVVLAVLAAMLLQGTVGFGSGLLAIPLLLWAGLPLPESIALVMTVGMCQTGYSAWHYRQHVPWRNAIAASFWRAASLPVGLWLLTMMVDLGQQRVKQVVGVAVALAVVTQWLGKARPRKALPGYWMPIAGISSGIMAGAVGMGGPPIVLWAAAHDWSSRQTRSFLWATFLMVMPLQLGLLVWQFGGSVLVACQAGLALVPVAFAGVQLGHRLGNRLSPARLRTAMFLVLLAIAAVSIIGPWL